MSFIAFLVFGGLLGIVFSRLYPAKLPKKVSFFKKVAFPAILGALATFFASVLGQTLGFFKAGQMLEWLSAMACAALIILLYRLASHWCMTR